MKEFKEILFEVLDDEYTILLKKYYTLNELRKFELKVQDNIIFIKNTNEYIHFDNHC